MRVELRKTGGEEMPFVLLECQACGSEIPLKESEIRTSAPIRCTSCRVSRSLSYVECITISDAAAPFLLDFLVRKHSR